MKYKLIEHGSIFGCSGQLQEANRYVSIQISLTPGGFVLQGVYPPEDLTGQPLDFRISINFSRWSPWISMVPSLTVPPEPHRALSSRANLFNSAEESGTPVIVVTPLPLRPFVSRPNRTMPSPAGTFDDSCLQTHPSAGCPHAGHILPWSVEYTSPLILSFFNMTTLL